METFSLINQVFDRINRMIRIFKIKSLKTFFFTQRHKIAKKTEEKFFPMLIDDNGLLL